MLVKKGVIDCENDTQCADDRACLDSIEPDTRGRMLCEKPCHEYRFVFAFREEACHRIDFLLIC